MHILTRTSLRTDLTYVLMPGVVRLRVTCPQPQLRENPIYVQTFPSAESLLLFVTWTLHKARPENKFTTNCVCFPFSVFCVMFVCKCVVYLDTYRVRHKNVYTLSFFSFVKVCIHFFGWPCVCGPGSSVGIATDYGLDGSAKKIYTHFKERKERNCVYIFWRTLYIYSLKLKTD
jgi:hypothetical protein